MLATCAILFALGFWTYNAVESSLRQIRAESMRGLLDSEVNALRVWISEEIADTERIAREPGVRAAVAALVVLAQREGTPRAELCTGAARARIEEALRPLLRELGEATFNLAARDGRLLATRFPEYCGLSLTRERFLPELLPVFEGRSRFIRPFADADRVAGAPRLRDGPAFAWIVAPVLGPDGTVIAGLGVAHPVDGVFGSIVGSARSGAGSEALAFDRHGRFVTAQRFGEATALHARMGESLEGVALEPYANYAGRPVIGAWRWLPEYGLGVGIQMDAQEAYSPLRYLRIAFGVVFGALVVAAFAALASTFSMLRLRSQIGRQRRLGPYQLVRRIGEGGVAAVYLARHDLLKRPTAVKLLKPARATDEMIARFEREVQLASSLAHPNTVEIFDYGRTREGLFYYAMEYLDGLTVSELLARQSPVPVARTIHLLRQACAALAEAHGKGLVHRDIKPENVMVCRYGGEYDFVKILDFGLVKHMTGQHSRDLTRSLRILGTPLYMAPERLRNPADVDARADIYAIGALAYLMLTGRRLFDTSDDLELTSKILNEEPPRAAEVAPQPLPVELDLLVLSCIEKKRENRPQRIADLIEALDALAAEHRWTQREAEAWWSAQAVPGPAPGVLRA